MNEIKIAEKTRLKKFQEKVAEIGKSIYGLLFDKE